MAKATVCLGLDDLVMTAVGVNDDAKQVPEDVANAKKQCGKGFRLSKPSTCTVGAGGHVGYNGEVRQCVVPGATNVRGTGLVLTEPEIKLCLSAVWPERTWLLNKGKRFLIEFEERRYANRLSLAAYACICAALALVILLGLWGALRDIRAARETALEKEIATIRSHAIRTVGRIERGLEQQSEPVNLESVGDDPWIRQFWRRVVPREERRLYAAIVDSAGQVVMHSAAEREGQLVAYDAFIPVEAALGEDVYATRNQALAHGREAFDVRVHIEVGDRVIGHYHTGVDGAWFKEQALHVRGQILRRWSIVIGGISIVVLLAGASLYYIAYRSAALHNVADMVQLQRVTELGQMAAGLAHEIRNPLHALRLNLHSLGRMQNGKSQGKQPTEDVSTIISQSNDEIARLDRLVEELLGFAKPDEAREEDIDLISEVKATASFLSHDMQNSDVEIGTEFSTDTAVVQMDPARFRQIMLNLLMNAKESIETGGRVDVRLSKQEERIQVCVCDNGSGIDEQDRLHVFDPFFTTKEHGSGLGLSLVKRFVEEANGHVDCESNGVGTTFCISLPSVSGPKQVKDSSRND